jgi:hypothetical protein
MATEETTTEERTPVPALLTRSLTARLVWTAGFLDGEGTFSARRWTRSPKVAPLIQCGQVQRAPLEWLQACWGGSIDRLKRRASISRDLPIFNWRLHNSPAVRLMMTLYPLLSPNRRAQVRKALIAWHSRPPAPRYRTACPSGHPYGKDRRCRPCRLGQKRAAYWRQRKGQLTLALEGLGNASALIKPHLLGPVNGSRGAERPDDGLSSGNKHARDVI